MMSDLSVSERDLHALAQTLYGEARGEYTKVDVGVNGLIAVGNVVLNRWRTANRFGNTIYDTCRQPYQFSCWNRGDPNLDLLNSERLDREKVFKVCQELAERMVQDPFFPDITLDANHYHATSLKVPPRWAQGRQPTLRLGGHIFYKL
ncbi:MAG: cell wall hydrolase [bacterium]|nr:cell wall hydrolase [bacterium]